MRERRKSQRWSDRSKERRRERYACMGLMGVDHSQCMDEMFVNLSLGGKRRKLRRLAALVPFNLPYFLRTTVPTA